MFDDLKQDSPIKSTAPNGASNTNNSTVRQPQRATGIDDMFDDVDPVASASSGGPVDPNKPSAVKSGKIKVVSQTNLPTSAQAASQVASYPVIPQPVRPSSMPTMSLDDSMIVTDGRSNGVMRKIIITFLVIVLLALVGGGVYYFFLRTNGLDNNAQPNDNANNNVANENNNQVDVFNESDQEPTINEDELDDDFDGLSNGLEKTYGTNPLEVDSDNDGVFDQDEVETHKTDPLADDSDSDGLSDYQEIIIYKSDPNDPDTDGDTFLDGVEVLNGYNPLGAGKLEEATSTSNLNTNNTL